jgi:Zn-dependent protease with chaperone function
VWWVSGVPVLLVPSGIEEDLTPPQLEAVLTHEVCHIRRRDNVTAAVHMIAEAVVLVSPAGVVDWIASCR